MVYAGIGEGGGEGRSVVQASQQRYVEGLTQVQMSHSQSSLKDGFGGILTSPSFTGLVFGVGWREAFEEEIGGLVELATGGLPSRVSRLIDVGARPFDDSALIPLDRP